MTCHGYARSPNSSVILSFYYALVPYYTPKRFYPVEKEDGTYKNIPEDVMEKVNGVGIHKYDNILKCQASVPSIVNTLNKLSIPKTVYIEFKYSYFGENTIKNIKRN